MKFLFFKKDSFQNENQNQNQNNKIIVLLGDSILNNNGYVASNESIPYLLKVKCKATLLNLAQNNATITSVFNQIDKIPSNLNNKNTFVFLSIGGNDLLNNFTDINTLITKYDLLIQTIETKLPNSNLILLNLYYPFKIPTSFYLNIKKWNENIENQNKTWIDLTKIIKKEKDLIADIEPSFIGGTKMVDSICNYI